MLNDHSTVFSPHMTKSARKNAPKADTDTAFPAKVCMFASMTDESCSLGRSRVKMKLSVASRESSKADTAERMTAVAGARAIREV